ncbi:MAG TPA: AMP-binding protein, partial [Tabrizicola sp.]|nr:AMP-binding protein [Tabrizicola sp.]
MATDIITALKRSAATPDRPWLLNDTPATYADLLAATARLANTLHALGLTKGDRLLLQAEKCPEVLTLYLACLRAGIVFLPVNPAYTLAETQHFLTDAEPALAVADPDRSLAIAATGARSTALPDLLAAAAAQSPVFSDPAH